MPGQWPQQMPSFAGGGRLKTMGAGSAGRGSPSLLRWDHCIPQWLPLSCDDPAASGITIVYPASQPQGESGSRLQKRGHDAGKSEKREEGKGDKREDHGKIKLPGFKWLLLEYQTPGDA